MGHELARRLAAIDAGGEIEDDFYERWLAPALSRSPEASFQIRELREITRARLCTLLARHGDRFRLADIARPLLDSREFAVRRAAFEALTASRGPWSDESLARLLTRSLQVSWADGLPEVERRWLRDQLERVDTPLVSMLASKLVEAPDGDM